MKFPFKQYGTVQQMKHEDVRCNILHGHIHLICSLRPTIPIGVGDFIKLGMYLCKVAAIVQVEIGLF